MVAAVLLWLGLLAGAANREVLAGARFAEHVDAVRIDPQVAHYTGQAELADAIQAGIEARKAGETLITIYQPAR